MESKEEQYKVLELLAQHEEAVRDLYTTFGKHSSSMKDFWIKIAGEESLHARWIRDLRPKIEMNLAYLNTKKFTERSIFESIDYLQIEKAKVEGGKYSDKAALMTALGIENALIDSKVLELFETDTAELKHFLNYLVEETKKHIAAVKEKIK